MPKRINFDELPDDDTPEVEEEFRFNPAKARQMLQPKGVKKVRVTMYLDEDVVEFFKQRAKEANAVGYQTQINGVLRAVLKDVSEPRELDPQSEALAERIAEKIAARLKKGKSREAA